MPVYDYKCSRCGHVRAVYVSPAPEVPAVMALTCGEPKERHPESTLCNHERQVSAPNVIIPKQHRAA